MKSKSHNNSSFCSLVWSKWGTVFETSEIRKISYPRSVEASLSHSISNCHLSISSRVSIEVISNTIFCIVLDINQTVEKITNPQYMNPQYKCRGDTSDSLSQQRSLCFCKKIEYWVGGGATIVRLANSIAA